MGDAEYDNDDEHVASLVLSKDFSSLLLSPLPSQLSCPICMCPILDAVTVSCCGITLCMRCSSRLTSCPFCRLELGSMSFVRNHALDDAFRSLEMRCKYGCQAVFPISECKKHRIRCPKAINIHIKCPYSKFGCTLEFACRDEMASHVSSCSVAPLVALFESYERTITSLKSTIDSLNVRVRGLETELSDHLQAHAYVDNIHDVNGESSNFDEDELGNDTEQLQHDRVGPSFRILEAVEFVRSNLERLPANEAFRISDQTWLRTAARFVSSSAPDNMFFFSENDSVVTRTSTHRNVFASVTSDFTMNGGLYLIVYQVIHVDIATHDLCMGIITQDTLVNGESFTSAWRSPNGFVLSSRDSRAWNNSSVVAYDGAPRVNVVNDDIVCVLVDQIQDRVHYIRNGNDLGPAHVLPSNTFVPCVDSCYENESVRLIGIFSHQSPNVI